MNAPVSYPFNNISVDVPLAMLLGISFIIRYVALGMVGKYLVEVEMLCMPMKRLRNAC